MKKPGEATIHHSWQKDFSKYLCFFGISLLGPGFIFFASPLKIYTVISWKHRHLAYQSQLKPNWCLKSKYDVRMACQCCILFILFPHLSGTREVELFSFRTSGTSFSLFELCTMDTIVWMEFIVLEICLKFQVIHYAYEQY